MKSLPENILKRMDPKDRAPLGKGFKTSAEAQATCDAQSEKQVQKQIENWFRLNGIPAFRQRMDRKSNMPIGTPDFLVCLRGGFWAFEVKVGNNIPTQEQNDCLNAIQNAGGYAWIVNSLEEVKQIIEGHWASEK